MWQDDTVATIRDDLADHPALAALFLAGSLGRGEGDAYSDVDLLAIVPPEAQAAFAADWKRRLSALFDVVQWNDVGKGLIFNAITADWHRIDVVIDGTEHLRGRTQDGLKPILDPSGLHVTIPATRPWTGPNVGRVRYLIDEFLRVLGLLPVGCGRGEYLLCTEGVNLLRMALFGLLSEEVERVDKGGMLAWSRRFSPEQMAALAAVPLPEPRREAVIAAHLAAARVFLPRARRLATRCGLVWPEALEAAALRHWQRELGVGWADVSPPS
jgi:predicted nucleotidyltransferase